MQHLAFVHPANLRKAQPETEYDVIMRRAEQAEYDRKERQKSDRRATRRARVARVFGR
jgi:hypothetical protein